MADSLCEVFRPRQERFLVAELLRNEIDCPLLDFSERHLHDNAVFPLLEHSALGVVEAADGSGMAFLCDVIVHDGELVVSRLQFDGVDIIARS